MPAPALLCATAEVALNRYLRLERSVLDDCARLEGRRLAVTASDLGWTFVVEPIAGGVRVLGENLAETPADVHVSAPTLTLARVATTVFRDAGRLPAGLAVSGDVELLRRFTGLLARVGFDPEELVAKLVGDGAAHRLVGGLRGLIGFGRTAASQLSRDTAEYLTEETGDLARTADVEDWMSAVDQLREDTDRFEARLRQLERRAVTP